MPSLMLSLKPTHPSRLSGVFAIESCGQLIKGNPPCEFSARMLRKGCTLPDPDGGKGRAEGQRAVRHLLSLWGNFLLSSLVALKLLLVGVHAVPARHLTGREEEGMARRASCPPVELASAPQVGCSPWRTPSLLRCKCDDSWM